jgi:hypothetical protein
MNGGCGAPQPGTNAGYQWHINHGGGAVACAPCKEAGADYRRLWYQENKKAAKEYNRRHRERNPGYAASYHRRSTYGLSEADYQQLLEQYPACAICGTPWGDTRATGPNVDHNHTTGAVRGLLCSGCNTSLGLLKESQTILRRAIAYLALHEWPDDAI